MRKRAQLRWREKRDSLVGKRRRRRRRRRDVRRGGDYLPVRVDPSTAARGVRSRLRGAVAALTVTAVCAATLVLSPLSTFAAIFALTMGVSSFAAAVGLVLSARREEEVHEFALQLDRVDREEPILPPADEPASFEWDGEPESSRVRAPARDKNSVEADDAREARRAHGATDGSV